MTGKSSIKRLPFATSPHPATPLGDRHQRSHINRVGGRKWPANLIDQAVGCLEARRSRCAECGDERSVQRAQRSRRFVGGKGISKPGAVEVRETESFDSRRKIADDAIGQTSVRSGERLATENAPKLQPHEGGRTTGNHRLRLRVAKNRRRARAFGPESDTTRDRSPVYSLAGSGRRVPWPTQWRRGSLTGSQSTRSRWDHHGEPCGVP